MHQMIFYQFWNLLQTIDNENKEILIPGDLNCGTSSALIDYFITNEPEKNSKCGMIHTGISDHSPIYAIRKISINHKDKENIIEIRNMKNFNENKFLHDLKS